jgi:hypothetical protein
MKSPKKAIDTKSTKAPKTKAAKPSAKIEKNPVKSKIADDEDEFELPIDEIDEFEEDFDEFDEDDF